MVSESFSLPVYSPFRLDYTVWVLRRRQHNMVDRWENHQYIRALFAGSELCKIVAEQKKENELEVNIISQSPSADLRGNISGQLKRILGIESDLKEFYILASRDATLKPLAGNFMGVKPPRFVSVFEALLNAISCQQLTLDFGITLLNRLSENFGRKLFDREQTIYAFPRAEDIAGTSVEAIRGLGFSYQKARAILELSEASAENKIDLDFIKTMTNEAVTDYLIKLRGIGRWSAEYVLLRGLGRLDVFPGDDAGAQRNLMNLFKFDHKPSYNELKGLTGQWQPYAGLVYFHLLLNKLEKSGVL